MNDGNTTHHGTFSKRVSCQSRVALVNATMCLSWHAQLTTAGDEKTAEGT